MLEHLTEREAEAVRVLRRDLWTIDAGDDPRAALERLARSLRSYHPWALSVLTISVGEAIAELCPTLDNLDTLGRARLAELCEAVIYATRTDTTTEGD